MLGTSLSASNSIGNELQIKQQEMFGNLQVKTEIALCNLSARGQSGEAAPNRLPGIPHRSLLLF